MSATRANTTSLGGDEMATNQQNADAALQHWQDLRARFPNPEERIEQLMFEFFRHPVASAVEYDATLRQVSEAMSS
jgi:hypothetical protein